MSRRMQFVTLSLIVGVSVIFGMLITTSLYQAPRIRAEASTLSSLPAMPASAQPAALPSFADIAEKANPAVVAIRSVEFSKARRAPQTMFNPFDFFFGPNADPHHRRQGNEDDQEEEQGGDGGDPNGVERRMEASGSGFIIRKDGYILTNHHVVDGASKLIVTLDSGERYDATVKGKDEATDVALLKIDCPHDLPALPMGDAESSRIGEWVMAIGNPLGDQLGESHSITIGVLSAKGRQLRDLSMDASLANYLQTDAAINFGNSGGPLLNTRGEVIGINTAISRNYGNQPGLIQGIGFALPIDIAKGVLDQLMTTGKVQRGALSIGIQPVTEEMAKYYNLPSRKGAFVQTVTPDGPADRAGMQKGDIILSVDGRDIAETGELIKTISARRPGESVNVGILRDGKNMTLKVKLIDRKETLKASMRSEGDQDQGDDDSEKPATAAKLGFTVSDITQTWEKRWKMPRHHVDGVIVTNVSPESRAWENGVREGMIITRIGKDPVPSVEDFRHATQNIKKGQIVRLFVSFYPQGRNGETGSEESQYVFFEAE
jgi:serine protease Do